MTMLSLQSRLLSVSAVLCLVLIPTCLISAARFHPIYSETIDLTTIFASISAVPYISALSGDGSTIAGTVTLVGVDIDCPVLDCEHSAFVWSIETKQRRTLNDVALSRSPQRPARQTFIAALSEDGSSVLTTSTPYSYGTTIQRGETTIELQDERTDETIFLGTGLSSDGKTVIGSDTIAPLLWEESEGLRPFPGLEPNSQLRPAAISGDGETVALMSTAIQSGRSFYSAHHFTTAEDVVLWNKASGLQALQPISGHERSLVSGLSHDGTILVGASSHLDLAASSRSLSAVKWEQRSPVALSPVGNFDSTIATDVSADGSLVVGVARYEPTPETGYSRRDIRNLRTLDQAVLWLEEEPIVLHELLVEDYGLEEQLRGWRLTAANAISDDGLTIAGQGIDPEGRYAAWAVTLSIPEPSSMLLAVCALVPALTTKSRRR